MCGRARCALAPGRVRQAVHEFLGSEVEEHDSGEEYHPSENMCPGTRMPVIVSVRQRDKGPGESPSGDAATHGPVQLRSQRWGLVPSFTTPDTKPNFFRAFNARSETVATKPMFSRLLKRRRCLAVVQGFYEWKLENRKKQPYYFHREGRDVITFAGLYDCWKDGEAPGEDMFSFTIVTTEASERMACMHDRMPVILPTREACMQWLQGRPEDLPGLCRPYNGEDLIWHAVTPDMNKLSYKAPDCSAPLRTDRLASLFACARSPGKPLHKVPPPAGKAKRPREGHEDGGADHQHDATASGEPNAKTEGDACEVERRAHKQETSMVKEELNEGVHRGGARTAEAEQLQGGEASDVRAARNTDEGEKGPPGQEAGVEEAAKYELKSVGARGAKQAAEGFAAGQAHKAKGSTGGKVLQSPAKRQRGSKDGTKAAAAEGTASMLSYFSKT